MNVQQLSSWIKFSKITFFISLILSIFLGFVITWANIHHIDLDSHFSLLFIRADGDFIDPLFSICLYISFWIIPIGGVLYFIKGNLLKELNPKDSRSDRYFGILLFFIAFLLFFVNVILKAMESQ